MATRRVRRVLSATHVRTALRSRTARSSSLQPLTPDECCSLGNPLTLVSWTPHSFVESAEPHPTFTITPPQHLRRYWTTTTLSSEEWPDSIRHPTYPRFFRRMDSSSIAGSLLRMNGRRYWP